MRTGCSIVLIMPVDRISNPDKEDWKTSVNHRERFGRLLIPAMACSVMAGLLLSPGMIRADVFNMPEGQASLEFVTVVNPGNAGEFSGESAGGSGPDRICGWVDYTFQIGKYEVTNAQYCEFLNAVASSDRYGLYDPNMSDPDEGGGIIRAGTVGSYSYKVVLGCANKPINWVTFWDACRFVNWLHNSQGNGDTETGAYTLTPQGMAENTVARNPGWGFGVASEDEWYKAAYHKNDGATGNYWDYPTASDTRPTAEAPPGTDMVNGSASYGADLDLIDHELLNVASYTGKPSVSSYGTFDQGGNAHEYTDTILDIHGRSLIPDGSYRVLRGGSYNSDNNHLDLHAAWRGVASPGVSDDGESGDNDITFRVVASVPKIEFVIVGNPGNPGELSSPQKVSAYEPLPDRVCGAVDYIYQIGKYEVTNAQYCEFLNAVAASDPYRLYNTNMAIPDHEGGGIARSGTEGDYTYSVISGRATKPVKWVSFWDACRFANWHHNCRGNGDTETGAYTLTPEGIANNTVTRNAGWRYAVTSEDEWYKAAYHKNEGATGDYWDYPTGCDSPPTAEAPPGTDLRNGSANYDGGWGDIEETDIGAYAAKPSSSPCGTFDQGGNAWEWNETALIWTGTMCRGVRGGEASSNVGDYAPGISALHAMVRDAASATHEYNDVGFRVVRSMAGVQWVLFPEYMPLDPNQHGIKTFEWTYGETGQYTSAIGRDETVPYGSGPVSGVTITNHSDWGTVIVSNDGVSVKFLGGGEWYLATDTSLTAHPAGYVLGALYDGMIIDQGEHYVVDKDSSNWERVDDQMLFINIQDVTVPQGYHENAVVIWYLHTDFPHSPLDFHGKELDLGLALPSSGETGGHAATAVEIYALGIGLIAHGDIDAATSSLNNLATLKEIVGATWNWVPQNWNGDGIVSIIGDVPPFVDCLYFGDCPDWPQERLLTVGDCNSDGVLSIIGDVPCFVDCVYFGNCPN